MTLFTTLVMVWLSGNDLVSAKKLFQQHHTCELMGKRDRPERKRRFGALDHARIEAERTADDEAQIAAVGPPLFEPARQIDAGELGALTVECADERAFRDASGDLLGLSGLYLRPAALVGTRLTQLDGLDPCLPREQALVVGDAVGEGSSRPAHADDDYSHPVTTVRY